uniref:Uncharacterized protein n=1 Tax=uncultured bacterium BLR7 TaxID=506523 RepID=C0INN3_9BACT|nr:hypothetical protein AKSOIL_0077 [uncultured bacterium BLR7]
MAHAQFHKNQRVYVRPVGTWAIVERVVPQWTKGLDEPLRVYYDVGLGREFNAEELKGETLPTSTTEDGEIWRILRAPNKWQSAHETADHPYPGTYPIVVTGEADWGGWRVPGAEYALSPARIERQARLMTAAPRLMEIVKQLADWGKQAPGGLPKTLADLMARCQQTMNYIEDKSE